MLPIHFYNCANSVTHHSSEKQVCQPSVIVLICTFTSKGHIQRLICCKNCHQQIHSAPKSSFQDTPGTVQVFNVTVSTAALNTVIYHQQLNLYDMKTYLLRALRTFTVHYQSMVVCLCLCSIWQKGLQDAAVAHPTHCGQALSPLLGGT